MTDPETPKASDEAARWVVRLESGPLSADEDIEFKSWLAAAPHHHGALIRAKSVWISMDRLGAMAGKARIVRSGAGMTDVSLDHDFSPNRVVRSRPRRRFVLAAAASLGAVAVCLLSYYTFVSRTQHFAADVGEIRRITVQDGSGVVLNSGSSIVVRYQDATREVSLERGEVLFEVAKNNARPFIVHSGAVSVRAVGTAFVVRSAEDAVSVSVTEGVVEVAQPATAPQRVMVNERATVRPQQLVRVIHEDRSTMDRQLAWRDGMVSFAGESLAEAVNEVNRYSRRKIEIDDPKLRAKPIVGIFRVGDVDAFAQTAAAALGAGVESGDSVIRLVASKQP